MTTITEMVIDVFETAPWMQELFFAGLFIIIASRIQDSLGVRFFIASFISLIAAFLLSNVVAINENVIKFAWIFTVVSLGLLIIKKD